MLELKKSEYEKIDTEVRHQQNSNKLKLLDALDSYPRATQQAAQLLNSMLSRQVPDDPPAPRRSKRKPEEEETTGAFIPPAKRKKVDGQPINADAEDETEDSGRISNAATQASLAHTESHVENPPEEHSEKVQGNNNQAKKKRELQVGGWVSPIFSAVIDRSWLGKDTPDSRFDPKTYVPQPGDTVLYYPKGHRDFLKQFPDHLCKNKITRIPLWDRAKKEKLKSAKAKVAKNVEDLNGGASSTKAPPTWWNDEWLSNVEEGSLGSYPIVCRVEKGHAEFPPDPLADHKIVEADGTINWRFPNTAATAKAKKKAFLRLAVTLRPLTTVLPPTWTESGPVDVHSLVPPPPFTIQTFPSKTTPYLIPFVWGYISYHSLSLDDDITFPDSKAEQNGKIKAFASLGGCFGSCRLDDKRQVIANMLESWKHEDLTPKLAVPPQDAVVIREFLACCMSNATKNLTGEASALPSRENVPFVDFIRCTLPLWNGITALKDVYDRREVQVQFWDVNARKSFLNKDLELGAVRDFMEFGIPRTLDSILRAKLECSLDHFLGENAAASPFRPDITDNIAPSYSHAVPISMSFDRILRRLTEKNWQSYYRSFDALLADLNAIQDNCALYNSPDSYLVHSANEIIPAAKKFLSTIVSRHVKERAERVLAEKEKTSQASAPIQEDKEYRKSVCPFREPFQGQLYREWLVSTQTDALLQRHPCPNGRSQWVPQAGDTVLYSRELHAEFIRGHFDDLQGSQVGLPQITTKLSGVDENDDEPTKNDYVGGVLDGTTAPLHEWIEGRVIFARPEFPRQRKSTDEKESTFMTTSPILGVKVQTGSKSSVVFWRPCMFACDMVESTRPPVEHCACCGLHLATSFLRQKIEDVSSLLPTSPKLSFADQVPAIERALNLLKRRCINKTAVDYLRPSLTNKKAKEGYVPPAPKIGVDSLPSFEDELRGRTEEVGKTAISTRGITPKRGADEVAAFEQLINCNYLPPWFGGVAAKKEDDSPPLHESISPCPSLCLELIRLRLRNGYYRHKEAIAHDIVEAYTTSVLLYLAPFAEGKNPISMKKLVRVLNSTKYTLSRASTSDASKGASNASKDASKTKKGKKSGALSKPTSNQKMPKSPLNNADKPNNKKSLVARIGKFTIKIKISPFPTDSRPKKIAASAASGKALVKSGSAKASKNTKNGAENPANHSGLERNLTLTRREQEVVARLEGVRRLYTTALCIVGETLHFQHLNGLIPLAVSQKKICKKIQLPVESNFVEKAQAAGAHNVLTRLLQSIGRDSCTNRPKELEKKRPSVRVKFTVGGKPVKTETTVLIAAPASLASPSMPAIESGTVPVPPLGESQTPAANSEPLHPHSQKSVVVVRDNVKFNYSDYEKNTQLCRFLWKRDGREYPCARCQAHKKGLAMCRVVKRHSNMDFSLKTFAKKGGVDGYLKVMLQQIMTFTQPSSTESQAALSPVQVSRADKPGMASSSQSAVCHSQFTESSPNRENYSIKKTNNGGHVPSRTADPELCTSEARASEKVDNVVGDTKAAAAEPPIPDAPSSNGNTEDRNTFGIAIESPGGALHNIKPPAPAPAAGVIIIADTSPSSPATTTAEGLPSNENVKDTDTFGIVDETPDGALGDIKSAPAETTAEKAPPHNDAAKDTQANGNVDPRDMYRRAQKALDDARELAASAKVYFEAPAVLSDKFINENFPWDDSDGHYAFCVVCGLSGDLLICEGCPNTVHPACVNFSSLPEGDWFCNKCPPKQSASGGDHVEKTIASVNGNATDISAVDAVPSSANANEPLEKEIIEAVVLSQPSNQEDPAVSNSLAIEAVTSRAVDETADLGAPGIGGSKGIGSGVDEHRQEKSVANRTVKASTEGANDDSKSPNDTAEVGRIPMRVQFNEERATQLSAELDRLFFHRTGRERNAGKEKRKKSGREGEDEATGQDAGKPKAKFPVGYLIMKNFGVVSTIRSFATTFAHAPVVVFLERKHLNQPPYSSCCISPN